MRLRLAPRSLFGRMVLILIGGLLVAQLLSVLVNLAERDRLIQRAGGMRTAQRIGDIVELLDPLGPAERRRIVAVLNAPPLRVSLDVPPMEPAASLPEDAHTAMFVSTLRAAAGERELRIVRAEPARGLRALRAAGESGPPRPPHAGGMGMGKGIGPGRGLGGMAVVSQVRFGDGSWVTFDSTLPTPPPDLPQRLLLTLLILSVAVIAVSLIAVRWVTRPLHVLANAAEDLGRDIRRPPLKEDGPSEVRQAARAFNRMQAGLQRYLDDRVRLLAAISHDLKTPITRMRLRTELLDDEDTRARFEKDLGEMESMVGEALEFMRGEGGAEAARPIDVNALLESLQADEQELGHAVRIEGRAAAPFVGRAQQLKRCLANLIANAIRYGGQSTIRVEDSAASLTLRVLDDGPGIPENELERVFEPFYRLEESRSRGTGGTGLGLGIARNIARAHGGDLVLRNRPAGGLEAVLTLPRQAGTGAAS
jgi:signal transduction histidine kinase